MELFAIAVPVSSIKANLLDMAAAIIRDAESPDRKLFIQELKDRTKDWDIDKYGEDKLAVLFPEEYQPEFKKIVESNDDGEAWMQLPHVVFDENYLVFTGFDNCVIPLVSIAGGAVFLSMEFFRVDNTVNINPIIVTRNHNYIGMLSKFKVDDKLRSEAPELCESFDNVVLAQKKRGLVVDENTFFASGAAC